MSSRLLRESLALLRTRRFGTFWFATLLSNIGFWAQEVAEPWLLLSLGASSFLIGLDTARCLAWVNRAPPTRSCRPPAIQRYVDKTVSMFMLAIRSGMAVGSLLTGCRVHLLGVRTALAINGALAICIHLVLGRIWLRATIPTDGALPSG